jgi:aryl-alcohol dehydrogenase-like predicted oxidoreductase
MTGPSANPIDSLEGAVSERRELGRSGLRVTPLCLGGNVFGWGADEEASAAVLDAYVAAGGNAVDSADIYSAWVPGNRGGESEEIIGRWLAGRTDRDDLVIATKVGMAGGPGQPKGLTREIILRGVEDSLRRLQVDRIDLYYAHEDDPGTPLEETLGAFDELVRQGLVRTIAASNYPAERLTEALRLSDERGLARFAALQPPYNLLDRGGYEGELQEICLAEGLGVATYYSLARGFLSGKYRPGEPLPASPRAPAVARDYMHDRGVVVLETLGRVAEAHDASPAQVALAWVMARPGVTCAIASATTADQARELMGAVDLELSHDEIATLTEAPALA